MNDRDAEPTEFTPKGLEVPTRTRADVMANLQTIAKADGPEEVEDAAEQEVAYPADETDEG